MKFDEIYELIRNGENSGVEFKRDDIRPEQLAKEIVALLNFKGGTILLGVEDGGTVCGVTRQGLEEWVMNVCSHYMHPRIIPYYQEVRLTLRGAVESTGGCLHPRWFDLPAGHARGTDAVVSGRIMVTSNIWAWACVIKSSPE